MTADEIFIFARTIPLRHLGLLECSDISPGTTVFYFKILIHSYVSRPQNVVHVKNLFTRLSVKLKRAFIYIVLKKSLYVYTHISIYIYIKVI